MEEKKSCCRCEAQAVALWPTLKIGVEKDYYCQKHLEQAQLEFLTALYGT